ncbi:MAG: peptide chain release factor 3 [Actinobacteria bacterium]|nr:peptide chain release factor 3 [Actinomycetota bacterium]
MSSHPNWSPMMSDARVLAEAGRRRTFAIISHPDAGKTTLTEKFLLYAGAVEEAGAVRSRKVARTARSDWMELEKQRGISISSAVLRFDHEGVVFNLLDTPGHRDFSEDTYRVLSGVDAAVMVLDAAGGVEAQTEKLFAVCRQRGTPVITFVNKMDRPSPEPLAILDDIEATLGIDAHPVTWPVKPGNEFLGVVDRRDQTFHRYTTVAHGSTRAAHELAEWPADVPGARQADDELELLAALGKDHDRKRFLAGESTPVFFGSALSNFGVPVLLDAIERLAPPPEPRADVEGRRRALDAPFSGFVFKVQANMDPRHRDRIAFVRVCSGRFERGTTLECARTGKRQAAKYAHQVFGQERITVEEAFPGDVVGLVNAADLAIGDSLYEAEPVVFPPLPTFTPEHFRLATPVDRSRVKQFRRGLEQLDQEGVVQVLRDEDLGDVEPILAAVGALQFDVAEFRMQHEFNAPLRLRPAAYREARRTDEDSVEALTRMRDVGIYRRADGTPMALFRDRWQLQQVEADHPELTFDTIVTS